MSWEQMITGLKRKGEKKKAKGDSVEKSHEYNFEIRIINDILLNRVWRKILCTFWNEVRVLLLVECLLCWCICCFRHLHIILTEIYGAFPGVGSREENWSENCWQSLFILWCLHALYCTGRFPSSNSFFFFKSTKCPYFSVSEMFFILGFDKLACVWCWYIRIEVWCSQEHMAWKLKGHWLKESSDMAFFTLSAWWYADLGRNFFFNASRIQML